MFITLSLSMVEPRLCDVSVLRRSQIMIPIRLLTGTYSSSEKKTGVFSLRKFVGGPCDSLAIGLFI